MSDLAAAAAKLGVAEGIVKRSAEARAKATGSSVDEVLAAWAGGGSMPTASEPAASPESRGSSQTEEETVPETAPSAPTTMPEPPPVKAPAAAAARSELGARSSDLSPPLLVGRREGIGLTLTGSVGLLVLSVLLGFFLPSLPQPPNGVRSSNHAYSRTALAGREIYLQEGCGTCHTQLVRSVVPDAHLGPATLDDTNQVIGSRRIGPDLAAIGDRIRDTDALEALLAGEGNHPTTSLSASELTELLAYLRESR